jgi:hypothetical protein
MAGLLRHVAAAILCLVAPASLAGASTYYASDPNLGSARVVFQVLPLPALCFCPYRREMRSQIFGFKFVQNEGLVLAFWEGKMSGSQFF